ncbi:zinc-finger domain-containing protein [Litorimonas haliclonae]|uniref:zinc-finger domain-containing protein n=1 Tax=Litorimonas haliclonae TaxID=2081977 RepID=UPI0039EE732A
MSNSNEISQNHDDITVVKTKRVACDGSGVALGHPRIWLDMGQDTKVRCKYCDRVFVLDESAVEAGH